MGIDVWFKEDLARVLASSRQTMTAAVLAVGVQGPSDEYRRGFEDALSSVAVAVGVAVPGDQVPGELVGLADAVRRGSGGRW